MRMRIFVWFAALAIATACTSSSTGPGGNSPPIAIAGSDQNVTVVVTVNLSGSGTDPDGDTVTLTWAFVSRPAGSAATLANATSATPSFTADVAGTYDVRLTASDGNGGTGTDDVRIVATGNTPPVANAGADQNVPVATTVNLSGTGSDPNGDVLTFSWAFVSRPAGSTATLTNAGTATPSFVADLAGTYDVQVTVSDGNGGTDTDDVRIIASGSANRAPVANAGPDQAASTGAVVILNGTGSSDPDGNTLSFSWSFVSRPAGSAAVINNASSATASFTADLAGAYEVRLTVTDGQLAASDNVAITVTQANRAPILTVNAPNAVFQGTQVAIAAIVSDPDGDVVTVDFELLEKPAGAGNLTESGTNATIPGDVIGAYRIRVTASDGRGGTAQTEVVVGVNPNVAGSYGVTVTADVTGCGQTAQPPREGTMPVLQPSAGTVILDLPTASSQFGNQVSGSLVGEEFFYQGPLTLLTSSGSFTLQGTINGTITAGGQMNLGFSFAFGDLCRIPGTIVGTKN